jgi:hypothetical protein
MARNEDLIPALEQIPARLDEEKPAQSLGKLPVTRYFVRIGHAGV